MICNSCEYQFIFDPKKHFLTDNYFIKCIDKLSQKDTYYYTEDELFYHMAMKHTTSWVHNIIISVVLTLISSIVTSFILGNFYIITPILLFLIFLFLFRKFDNKGLKRKHWNKLMQYWMKQSKNRTVPNSALTNLITSPSLTQEPKEQQEPDLYDYGASKLLICEEDIQVDWLVMNQFHSQHGVVIIAESGYPHYLTEQVNKIIESNSQLQVYLLHNASAKQTSMTARLTTPQSKFNISHHQIIDLGLNESQLQRLNIRPSILKQYKGSFPVHALPYPKLSQILAHALISGTSLEVAMAVMTTESSSEISGDFG